MPRSKPTIVREDRRTLGDYERQMEHDRMAVAALGHVTSMVGDVARGIGSLGIAGGVLLGALVFNKELDAIKDNLVEMWPEGGAFLSPEWVAKWGANPIEQTEEQSTQLNNQAVNELPTAGLNGKSPYEVYTIAASGRAAEYQHRRNNIPGFIGPSQYAEGTKEYEEEVAEHEAQWVKDNPQPPVFMLLNQFSHQINLRYTAMKNYEGRFFWNRLFMQYNPRHDNSYINDNLFDWATLATYPEINGWDKNPKYDIKKKAGKALKIIETYSFWEAPTN